MDRIGLASRCALAGGMAIALIVAGGASETEAKTKPVSASKGMAAFVQDIGPGAAEAVAVVDAFSAAIRAVKLDQAVRLMDEQVLILESGGSERSRDQYLAEHAVADAAFMQSAKQQLRFRRARADGNMAWVATESIVTRPTNGKSESLLSTESMVLHKSAQGWRIVHVHWSSRRPKDS